MKVDLSSQLIKGLILLYLRVIAGGLIVLGKQAIIIIYLFITIIVAAEVGLIAYTNYKGISYYDLDRVSNKALNRYI